MSNGPRPGAARNRPPARPRPQRTPPVEAVSVRRSSGKVHLRAEGRLARPRSERWKSASAGGYGLVDSRHRERDRELALASSNDWDQGPRPNAAATQKPVTELSRKDLPVFQ